MRKTSQIALSVLLCVTMAFTSGCSVGKKKTAEKADSEYVTLGEYKKISVKKSEIDEQVQKQIDSTLDTYAEYKKKKTGKIRIPLIFIMWERSMARSSAAVPALKKRIRTDII